MNAEVRL